ncbi:MAG: glycosyltransferase, partial [Methanoregula sp.]
MTAVSDTVPQGPGTGIVAVIPAYNQEQMIGPFIVKTKQQVDRVIVVDAGSVDGTADVAKEAGADVIHLTRNTGQIHALMYGLQRAQEMGFSVALSLDSENEYDPQEINRVAGTALSGKADLVIGSRFLSSAAQKLPDQKFTRMNLKSGQLLMDSASPVKAFNKKSLDSLVFKGEQFRFSGDLISYFDSAGFTISEIPITMPKLLKEPETWEPPTKILAVIPAYNEELVIGSVVLKALQYVNKVIVVDDGS